MDFKKLIEQAKLAGIDPVEVYQHMSEEESIRVFGQKVDALTIISESEDAGVHIVMARNGREFFITGHSEYDADTLKNEYIRDVGAGLNPDLPVNYFPDDDPTKEPMVTWRAHANLLYSNWLNYFVYQTTPYDIKEIK